MRASLSQCALLSAGQDLRVRAWHVDLTCSLSPLEAAGAGAGGVGSSLSAIGDASGLRGVYSLSSSGVAVDAVDPLTAEHIAAQGLCEPVAYPALPWLPTHTITMAAAALLRGPGHSPTLPYAAFIPTTKLPMGAAGTTHAASGSIASGSGGGAAHAGASVAGHGGRGTGDGMLGSPTGSVLVVDAASGQVLRELHGAHHAAINAVAFLPTKQVLLSAGDDGAIMLWTGPLLQPASVGPLSGAAEGDDELDAAGSGLGWMSEVHEDL